MNEASRKGQSSHLHTHRAEQSVVEGVVVVGVVAAVVEKRTPQKVRKEKAESEE